MLSLSQIKAMGKKKGSHRRNSHRCRLEQLEGREMFSALPVTIPIDATGDFNGDGYEDVAYQGSQAETVEVRYGSPTGLSETEVWSQASPGIQGKKEAGDRFGSSLAVGDFNGDGFDDLAIGASREDLGFGKARAGVVNVIYGSVSGMTATGDQLWHQNSPGIAGKSEFNDWFGDSLIAGDFNGDGFDDLAIGAPGETFGACDGPIGYVFRCSIFGGVNVQQGAVHVIYGSGHGLTSAGSQLWTQNSTGIAGKAEKMDNFGCSLAAGDFNGDGHDDLAIGVSGEDIGRVNGAGAVNVIYGSSAGLTAAGNQIWHQDSPGILGRSESGDRFGESLAVGDFNGDGCDDLAIGVFWEDIGRVKDAGAVNVIYGSSTGLTAAGNQIWHQDSPGILGRSEKADQFGQSLAIRDFDGDGCDDLVIGVPGEDSYTRRVGRWWNRETVRVYGSGMVNVIHGSSDGLAAAGNQLLSPDEIENLWVASLAKANLSLTHDDNAGLFNVEKGHTIEVRLRGNPSTGYSWRISDVSGQAIVLDGPVQYEADSQASGLPGGGGVYVFRFSADQPGPTTLNLEYVRPWENAPVDTFTVTIDVLSGPSSVDMTDSHLELMAHLSARAGNYRPTEELAPTSNHRYFDVFFHLFGMDS